MVLTSGGVKHEITTTLEEHSKIEGVKCWLFLSHGYEDNSKSVARCLKKCERRVKTLKF